MEGKSEIQQQVTHPENIQVVTPEWLESYTGNNWQAQRLVITDETLYQNIRCGYVLCPDEVSVVNVVGFDPDIKMYWCIISGAKCFIDGSDYKKVISAYPTIPDVPQIDLSDIRRWMDEGCKESVELEMQLTSDSHKVYGEFQRPDDDYPEKTWYEPTLTNNTVKMVWSEKDKAQPIAGEVETEAKFRYQHFENSATRNHFELGFIDGANWREHHPATDWDALRDKLKELCKYKININDDGIDGIINFFKTEIN